MWVRTEILNISWFHFGVSAVAIRVVGIKAMEPFVHTTLLNNLKMTLSVYSLSAVQLFHQQLHDFTAHQYRVSKQLREIRFVRENCSTNQLVLHIAFSEYYSEKYAHELQAAHYGDRSQITLYHGLAYMKEFYVCLNTNYKPSVSYIYMSNIYLSGPSTNAFPYSFK